MQPFSQARSRIYMLERLANSTKFAKSTAEVWRRIQDSKTLCPMAQDIAMLGTRETGDQMTGALSYGIKNYNQCIGTF